MVFSHKILSKFPNFFYIALLHKPPSFDGKGLEDIVVVVIDDDDDDERNINFVL